MQPDTSSPFQYIPLDKIEPSRTNPRKRFPEDKMQELATNIKAHGVLQPILVRPVDKAGRAVINDETLDHFEIVAGERRYRASKLADQVSIPAIVRELTDIDALELQIHENLHREDLHPIEEAEGFQYLLDKSNPLTGLTVEQLCEKVGKSRSYVFSSLKLLDLCAYGRDAFFDGKMNASIALLIARIPGEKLQTQAIQEVANSYNPYSVRQAAHLIQSRFMLKLPSAKFKITDANLVPAAGSCKECPKRTGNCPELFPDVESADVCTDPNCFEAKGKAHLEQLRESGATVLEGAEAKKIMPNSWTIKGAYVKLDENLPGSAESIRKALGNDKPEVITLVSENGKETIEVVKKADVEAKLAEKGKVVKFREEVSQSQRDREVERQAKMETAYRIRLLQEASKRITEDLQEDASLEDYEQTIIAKALLLRMDHESEIRLLKLRNPDFSRSDATYEAVRKLKACIPDMTTSERLLLILQMSLIGQCYSNQYSTSEPEDLLMVAKHTGLKMTEIRAEVEAEFAPKPKGKKPEKAAPTPPTAAQAQETTAQKTDEENPEGQTGHSKDPEDPLVPIEKTAETAAQAEEANLPPGFQKAKAKALAKKAKAVSQKVPAKAGGAKKASAAAAAEETKGATV
jgi:ParB/RepB/Spo0J family partition protein